MKNGLNCYSEPAIGAAMEQFDGGGLIIWKLKMKMPLLEKAFYKIVDGFNPNISMRIEEIRKRKVTNGKGIDHIFLNLSGNIVFACK